MKVRTEDGIRDMRALWLEGDEVVLMEQRALPGKLEHFRCRDHNDVARAIKDMVVRGAPAIGAAAALGMAQAELRLKKGAQGALPLEAVGELLKATRPTAYDLFFAVDRMLDAHREGRDLVEAAKEYVEQVVERCRLIGEHGEPLIPAGARCLTHCNAGALATVDWGTALAPLRAAHRKGKDIFVFADETRPRLQGARLTAWELHNEGIPCAIICDNAAGHLMQRGEIDLVITGTDRVTASGDAANKIGTYEKAVLAKENGIPFYVAMPASTIDFAIDDWREIPIEERGEEEVLVIDGVSIAPEGVKARNPAFDVTPARYIEAFITELGVHKPGEIRDLQEELTRGF
jgi:translation initiation factor eIF-2B subunit alpha/methylthioribose-1-phosphate isomerase